MAERATMDGPHAASEVLTPPASSFGSRSALRVEIREAPDPDWDRFVVAHSRRNPVFATSSWAAYLQRHQWCVPWFLSVVDASGVRVAAWLVFCLGFSTLRHGWKRHLSLWLGDAVREVVWWSPPVIATSGSIEGVTRALVGGLRAQAARARIVRSVGGLWVEGGAPFGVVSRWATLLVDCRGTEAELRSRLKTSARKGLSYARTHAVTVRRIPDRVGLRAYDELGRRASERSRMLNRSLGDLEAAWDCLRSSGTLEFFIAEHRGEPISGLGVVGCDGWITEFALYQSQRPGAVQLSGQDAINWEILRWARANGLHTFDLCGVSPSPRNTKEWNIRRFKEKWGGTYTEYPVTSSCWLWRGVRRW